MYYIRSLIFLFYFYNMSVLADDPGKMQGPDNDKWLINFKYTSKPYFDENLTEPEANVSFANLTLGKYSLHQLLNEYEIDADRITDVIAIESQFSLVPFIVEDFTRSTVEQRIDEEADALNPDPTHEFRQELSQDIRDNINDFRLDPSHPLNRLTNNEIDALVLDQTNQALEQLAFDVTEQQRRDAKEKANQRLDEVKERTQLHTLAIRVSHVLGNGHSIIFLRAGQLIVNGAGTLDDSLQTVAGQYRVSRSQTEYAMDALSTPGLHLGYVHKISKDKRIRAEVYVFHNRLPFISAQSFIANTVLLDDEEYETQIGNEINSSLIRLLFNSELIDAHISTGSFDSRNAFSGGLNLKLKTNTTISLNYFSGDRVNLSEGQFLQVSQKLPLPSFVLPDGAVKRFVRDHMGLSFYGSHESLHNSMERQYDYYNITSKEIVLGAKVTAQYTFFNKFDSELSWQLECYDRDIDQSNNVQSDPGPIDILTGFSSEPSFDNLGFQNFPDSRLGDKLKGCRGGIHFEMFFGNRIR